MSAIRIAAVGDALVTRRTPPGMSEACQELAAVVKDADIGFANLEFSCPQLPGIPGPVRHFTAASAPAVLDDLKEWGLSLFSAANNHIGDYTHVGVRNSIASFRARDVTFAGAGLTLEEARAPAFREVQGCRVALVAASSSDAEVTLAADPNAWHSGRPGINPLRFETRYIVDQRLLRSVREIDQRLGTAATTRRRISSLRLGDYERLPESECLFLGRRFVLGDSPRVETRPNSRDLDAICAHIAAARARADIVIASMHAHEGQNDDWNSETPADFVVIAAHRFIDAGAQVVIGHGPHMLRGIEVYNGGVIFYSLGNFSFQVDGLEVVPGELYQLFGLPENSQPAALHQLRRQFSDGTPRGFYADDRYWRSVVALCTVGPGGVESVQLRPVELSRDGTAGMRGVPSLARGAAGLETLRQLAGYSARLGTGVEIVETKHDSGVAGLVPVKSG